MEASSEAARVFRGRYLGGSVTGSKKLPKEVRRRFGRTGLAANKKCNDAIVEKNESELSGCQI